MMDAKLLTGATILATILMQACGGDGGTGEDGQAETSLSESAGAAQSATADAGQPAGGATQAVLEVDPALLPAGVTVEMVREGRELFTGGGICFTCHLPEGTGGPLAPDLTDDAWLNVDGEYLSIVELVKTGVPQPVEHPGAMLPRAGLPLTDEQVEAVAAYAYMLSRM